MEIKYIGFYDLPGNRLKRAANLAAINKMDYICDAINRAGYKVHIVSPSWYIEDAVNAKYTRQTTIQITPNKRITFCPSFGTKNKLTRNLKIILTLAWLFFWLLKHIKRNEIIFVYHVQWLSLPLYFARKCKNFRMILEVEEIYQRVWKNKKILNWLENILLNQATWYITASSILADEIGNKVKCVVYGNYSIPNILKNHSEKKNKINIIYAGSIDKTKGGAYISVKCAIFLPENYYIHICGFGNEVEIENLNLFINEINSKLKRRACFYHGIKIGDEYSKLLLDCDIAINSQLEGKYMQTAFPSKIVSYFSHNLRVVSTRINSILRSPFSSIITFAESDSPESIAKAIMSVDLNCEFNSVDLIEQLDKKFVDDLKILLHG